MVKAPKITTFPARQWSLRVQFQPNVPSTIRLPIVSGSSSQREASRFHPYPATQPVPGEAHATNSSTALDTPKDTAPEIPVELVNAASSSSERAPQKLKRTSSIVFLGFGEPPVDGIMQHNSNEPMATQPSPLPPPHHQEIPEESLEPNTGLASIIIPDSPALQEEIPETRLKANVETASHKDTMPSTSRAVKGRAKEGKAVNKAHDGVKLCASMAKPGKLSDPYSRPGERKFGGGNTYIWYASESDLDLEYPPTIPHGSTWEIPDHAIFRHLNRETLQTQSWLRNCFPDGSSRWVELNEGDCYTFDHGKYVYTNNRTTPSWVTAESHRKKKYASAQSRRKQM